MVHHGSHVVWSLERDPFNAVVVYWIYWFVTVMTVHHCFRLHFNSFAISAGTFNHLTHREFRVIPRFTFNVIITLTHPTIAHATGSVFKIQPSLQRPALRYGSSRCPWSLSSPRRRTRPLWVCEPRTEPFSPCSSVHQGTVSGSASDCPPIKTKTPLSYSRNLSERTS